MTNTQTAGAGSSFAGSGMARMLADNWWLVLLRGIGAVIFSILAFVWPGMTAVTLTLVWGAYALWDGAFAISLALTGRDASAGDRWLIGLGGVLPIAAGVVAFVWPVSTAVVLLYLIAGVAIIVGVLQIAAAIRLRETIDNEWLLALNGVVSIIFGIYIAAYPGAGVVSVIWIIAFYALFAGATLIALSFRMKGMKRK